jgi:hypothetical protein
VFGAQNMIRDDVAEQFEPKKRKLREDTALVGNWRRQDDIERGEPIGRNHEQPVAQVVDITNFPTNQRLDAHKMGFADDFRCRTCGHERLPLREALSILAHRVAKSM